MQITYMCAPLVPNSRVCRHTGLHHCSCVFGRKCAFLHIVKEGIEEFWKAVAVTFQRLPHQKPFKFKKLLAHQAIKLEGGLGTEAQRVAECTLHAAHCSENFAPFNVY